MSTSGARFAASLVDQLAPLGAVSHRRFFGGQGIVCGGVQFGMIIDDVLYFRTDAALAETLRARGAHPFVYGTRKRDVTVSAYWSVPEEGLDEPELLIDWARQSLAVVLQKQAAKAPPRQRAPVAAGKRKK